MLPFDDIKWDSKYQKHSLDYRPHPGTNTQGANGRPGADCNNGETTRFDIVEEANNDYDIRQFLFA